METLSSAIFPSRVLMVSREQTVHVAKPKLHFCPACSGQQLTSQGRGLMSGGGGRRVPHVGAPSSFRKQSNLGPCGKPFQGSLIDGSSTNPLKTGNGAQWQEGLVGRCPPRGQHRWALQRQVLELNVCVLLKFLR